MHLPDATARRSRAIVLFVLWAIVVANVIAVRSLWQDEAFSVRFAELPWADLWKAVGRYDPMFGEYYGILRVWNAFGETGVWERALSALFATGTLAITYRFARRLFDARVATAATVALAIHPAFLHEATEARPYALMTLGFALSLLAWDRAMRGDRPVPYLTLCAASLVTVYAHALSLLGLAPLFLATMIPPRPTAAVMRGVALAGIGVLIGVAPLAWTVVHAEAPQDHWQHNPTSLRAAAQLLTATVSGTVRPLPVDLVFAIVGFVSAARSGRRREAIVLVSLVVMPVLALCALSVVRPLFVPRYLTYITVPECVLIGRGIVAAFDARRWRVAGALAACYLAIVGVQGGRRLSGDGFDWSAAAAQLRANVRSRDAVAVEPGFEIDPLRIAYQTPLPGELIFPRDLSLNALIESSQKFSAAGDRDLAKRYRRIWIVRVPSQTNGPNGGDVQAALAKRFARTGTTIVHDEYDIEIDRYDARSAPDAALPR